MESDRCSCIEVGSVLLCSPDRAFRARVGAVRRDSTEGASDPG